MHVLLRPLLHGDAAEYLVLRSGGTGEERQVRWFGHWPVLHQSRTGSRECCGRCEIFHLSLQIGIGFIVDVLCFLPTLFFVQLFRRIRPRRKPNQLSPVVQALMELRPMKQTNHSDHSALLLQQHRRQRRRRRRESH